jgi:cytidyltransferase-like protein
VSRRFRRGLVVGKFCPLHLGHELLIRRAQAECDELLVLSYTKPGFDGYDRERRSGWLRQCPAR